jgi:hypothetical protein
MQRLMFLKEIIVHVQMFIHKWKNKIHEINPTLTLIACVRISIEPGGFAGRIKKVTL